MPRTQRTPPPAETNAAPSGIDMKGAEATPANREMSNVSYRSKPSKRARVDKTPNSLSGEESTSDEVAYLDRDSLVHTLDDNALTTIRHEIESVIASQLKVSLKAYFEEEFAKIKDSLKLLGELKDSVTFMSQTFDEIKSEFDTNKETIKLLTSENNILKNSMSDLTERVNILEQRSRQDNIEINGIPENKSENLLSTVLQLGNVISHNIQEQDIMSFTRVRKMDAQSDRPRSVVIKLRSTRVRDEILASVTKFNRAHPKDRLNSSHLGYGGVKLPVFVSEHLSPLNKAIHAETRKMAREKGYRYVWVRDGRILVRKDEGASARQIKSLQAVRLL